MSVILEAKHISKNFGLTQALKDVSVTIDEGEVIGLIGENGSGKSTLSSIISGVYPQSEGELTLDGKPYKPADTLDAQNHGISMIAQEMGTLPGIKVADNLFIGKEQLFTKHGVVDRKKMYQEARKALEKIGIDNIHPEDPIIKYSLEERKLIEVVRALQRVECPDENCQVHADSTSSIQFPEFQNTHLPIQPEPVFPHPAKFV